MAIKNKLKEINAKKIENESFLSKITYPKIEEYIDDNVTDIESARAFLKGLTKLIIYHLEEE